MSTVGEVKRIQTVVIGAGQAGLSVGYHLKQRGLPFVILEGNARVGDTWRKRWDSLRLFTAARFDGLAGLPFPAPPHWFPTKDEMADYLESYVRHFELPVETGVTVDRLTRQGSTYHVSAGDRQYEADQVVVAMATFQKPTVPAFAPELSPEIVHLHSSDYRNPQQLRDGAVLIVGAGNSGSEIAMELSRAGHQIWVSGRDVGHAPFRMDTFIGRHLLAPFLLRVVFHRILTTSTPMGRRRRPNGLVHTAPLIRVRPQELAAAGVTRVPKVVGVRNGLPLLENGQTLGVANVVWCTGFDPGFWWIDVPVFGATGEPVHERGVVTSEPGLYFVGLHYLHAMSSTMIHGVSRDAAHIVSAIEAAVSPVPSKRWPNMGPAIAAITEARRAGV